MYQLKYDDNYINIVRDIPHWKSTLDIPKHIIEYVKDTSNHRVLYEEDTGFFYCAKCLNQLDETNYCQNCKIQHWKTNKESDFTEKKEITVEYRDIKKEKYDIHYTCQYYIFDRKEENIWLYSIKEEVSYRDPFYFKPIKHSNISVDLKESFFVEKKGITNLETNEYISFKEWNDQITLWNNFDLRDMEHENKRYDEIYRKVSKYNKKKKSYLYTENLEELKTTIYKYSYLWNAKNYLKELDEISIDSLTFYPLFYQQFEYLIKFRLFNLAIHNTPLFEKGKSFKEIFGVEKNYLPFMVKNNITYNQLQVMKISPVMNVETLKFFEDEIDFCKEEIEELTNTYNLKLEKLMNFFLKWNLSSEFILEYIDYYYMALRLKLNLRDSKILYPDNLTEAHNDLYRQIQIIEDPTMDKKIKRISEIISWNNYEDNEYKIFPAESISDLVEESSQQNNCVRNYCTKIANNECQVYFMRRKENLKKSYVTIEVRDNRIIQARLKYNELPNEKIMNLLYQWEEKLVSFQFEK